MELKSTGFWMYTTFSRINFSIMLLGLIIILQSTSVSQSIPSHRYINFGIRRQPNVISSKENTWFYRKSETPVTNQVKSFEYDNLKAHRKNSRSHNHISGKEKELVDDFAYNSKKIIIIPQKNKNGSNDRKPIHTVQKTIKYINTGPSKNLIKDTRTRARVQNLSQGYQKESTIMHVASKHHMKSAQFKERNNWSFQMNNLKKIMSGLPKRALSQTVVGRQLLFNRGIGFQFTVDRANTSTNVIKNSTGAEIKNYLKHKPSAQFHKIMDKRKLPVHPTEYISSPTWSTTTPTPISDFSTAVYDFSTDTYILNQTRNPTFSQDKNIPSTAYPSVSTLASVTPVYDDVTTVRNLGSTVLPPKITVTLQPITDTVATNRPLRRTVKITTKPPKQWGWSGLKNSGMEKQAGDRPIITEDLNKMYPSQKPNSVINTPPYLTSYTKQHTFLQRKPAFLGLRLWGHQDRNKHRHGEHNTPSKPIKWDSKIPSRNHHNSHHGNKTHQKPITNIWYKPVINHYGNGTPDTMHSSKSPVVHTKNPKPPIVFKVWEFQQGNLTLLNENIVPTTLLNGFGVVDGSIINFEDIPSEVQQLVNTSIFQWKPTYQKQIVGSQSNIPIGIMSPTNHDFIKSNIKKVSTPHDPVAVNYVILDKCQHLPDTSPTPISTIVSTATVPPAFTDFFLNRLPSSTPTPTTTDFVSTNANLESQTVPNAWEQLHELIFAAQNVELPLPQTKHTLGANYGPTVTVPTKTVSKNKLFADMAATAILISFLHNNSRPLNSTVNPTPATQELKLHRINLLFDILRRIINRSNVTDHNTSEDDLLHLLERYEDSVNEEDQSNSNQSVEEYLLSPASHKDKSLLMGLLTKKKVGLATQAATAMTLPKLLMMGLLKLLMHKKQPNKDYNLDFSLNLDLLQLMKKKFLYILAVKYMPVFLIVALKLVPIGMVLIPLLWKIHWLLKKKHKHVKVPVPIPVHPPKPQIVYHVHPPDSFHGPIYDHPPDFHDDSSNYPERQFPSPSYSNAFPNDHPIEEPPYEPFIAPDHSPHQLNKLHPQYFPKRHTQVQYDPGGLPYEREIDRTSNSYKAGFNLGAALGNSVKNHDREVLKILIENKQKRLYRLLKKWILDKSNQVESKHDVTNANE